MKSLFLSFLCSILLLLATIVRLCAQAPDLLYYRFNGTGTTIPNLVTTPPTGAANATIFGGITQGGTAGQCNTGALIGTGVAATTDYVETGWATSLTATSWTIAFWCSNMSSPNLDYIFGDNTAGGFRCFTGTASIAGNGNWLLRGPFTDVLLAGGATNTPTLNAFVYDAVAGNIKAYLNGVLVNTVAQAPPTITSTSTLRVMGYAGNLPSAGAPVGGLLDEFRIYSRALNATELLTLVNPSPTVSITVVNDVCFGSNTTFTATPDGNLPTYQWTKNGVNITLATNATYTGVAGTDFVNGDLIRCVMTATNGCITPATAVATSNAITMIVKSAVIIAPATLPNGVLSVLYSQTITQTGLTGTPVWSISVGTLPTGFSIASGTGIISGTPTAGGTFSFTVSVTDGVCTQTIAYSIVITCPPIVINPSTLPNLPNGIVGSAYSQAITQTGLIGTPTWSISIGSLPAGLTINSTSGVISGTPTAAGTFNFTVSVTNGVCTQTKPYSIVINCPTLVFGVTTAIDATVGTVYSLNASVTGNTQPVVYTVSSLPAGLFIASGTGVISGTPTAATASATYTVTATQGTCTATQGYIFAVACPTLVFGVTTAIDATVGTAYSLNAGVTGNTATVVYTVTSLPAGLSIASGTGIISGTPTAPTASATYTVTATQGTCTATQGYTFVVACPTLVFGTTTATGATVGTAYSLNAGVTGNTQSVVYSVLPALPAGLSISSITGAISGTPTAPVASATYTVTATQGTCTATQGYVFAVACVGTTINPASLVNGIVGTAYTQTATQTGLTGTPVWSVTGTLPNGLSIAGATGIISGTPTNTGTFAFVVNVTDGACSQTKNYSIAVACPVITFTNTTASGAIVGIAYTLNAGVTGNTQAVVYSVLPALPAGLSLNTVTGAISGAATAVTASATYTVTATQTVDCANTQTYTFGVIPACTPVVLGLASIPNATIGTPYSQTFAATGGVTGATYVFTTLAPQFNGTGLSLSPAGVLSGTPTFSTSITFRVTATTPNGCFGVKDYTIVINPNPATSIDNSLASSVKVSPNPSSGDFNVDFGTINMAKSSVSVYDMQGKVVFTSENNNNLMVISLDKFANGIYLLEVKTENGRITKRLSKTN